MSKFPYIYVKTLNFSYFFADFVTEFLRFSAVFLLFFCASLILVIYWSLYMSKMSIYMSKMSISMSKSINFAERRTLGISEKIAEITELII